MRYLSEQSSILFFSHLIPSAIIEFLSAVGDGKDWNYISTGGTVWVNPPILIIQGEPVLFSSNAQSSTLSFNINPNDNHLILNSWLPLEFI